jgi:hypothetical protein
MGLGTQSVSPPRERPAAERGDEEDHSWRAAFQRQGFIRFPMPPPPGVDAARELAMIQEAYAHLPPDPYAQHAGRYRRYARAVLLPWSRTLEWIPDVTDGTGEPQSEYFQGSYNPEYPGEIRRFPAITPAVRHSALLHHMIWYDYWQTFWPGSADAMPVHVGVHLVKLKADSPGEYAVSSPNQLHRDGEPFTFAHLILHDKVAGGTNTIAAPACEGLLPADISSRLVLAQFELTSALDSYGVCDDRVSHYVSPITAISGEPGIRGIMLIDFTQMAQRI